MKSNLCNRIISTLTIITFLLTNTAYAIPSSNSLRPALQGNPGMVEQTSKAAKEGESFIMGVVMPGPTLREVLSKENKIEETANMKDFLEGIAIDDAKPRDLITTDLPSHEDKLERFVVDIFNGFFGRLLPTQELALDIFAKNFRKEWNLGAKEIKFISVKSGVLKAQARRYYDEKNKTVYIAIDEGIHHLYERYILGEGLTNKDDEKYYKHMKANYTDTLSRVIFERILEEIMHKNKETDDPEWVIDEHVRYLWDVGIPMYDIMVYQSLHSYKIDDFFKLLKLNKPEHYKFLVAKGYKGIKRIMDKGWWPDNPLKAKGALRKMLANIISAEPLAGLAFSLDAKPKTEGAFYGLLDTLIDQVGVCNTSNLKQVRKEAGRDRKSGEPFSDYTIDAEFRLGERLGIIERRKDGTTAFTPEFDGLTHEDLKDMQVAAEKVIGKGLQRGTLDRAGEETLTQVRKAVRDAVLVEGYLFDPKINFGLRKRVSEKQLKKWVNPSVSAEEARNKLLEAKKNDIETSVSGQLRGSDVIGGSSLDLPEFQDEYTEIEAKKIEEFPSTVAIASKMGITIKIEAADDPDAIEYVAPDYGIPEDEPLVVKGNVALDENGTAHMRFLPAFVFANLCGLKGIRITCPPVPAMALAGGMESSNGFSMSVITAASILSGANLSQADIFALAVKLENDVFRGLTGGQGHLCFLTGGIHQQVWRSGQKNEKGELVNTYGALAIPLATTEEKIKEIEDRFLLVQAGKGYTDGEADDDRTAALINEMWTDFIRFRIKEGIDLLGEFKAITARNAQAYKEGDWHTLIDGVLRYVWIRDELCRIWIRNAIDAHEGKTGLPGYASKFAELAFEEKHKDKYGLVKELYDRIGGEKLREMSLYTMEPIHSAVQKLNEAHIAAQPLGAGGPSSNIGVITEETKQAAIDILKAMGIDLLTEVEAKKIIHGTGNLKGYVPFEVSMEGIKINGFEELGLQLPDGPEKVTARKRDITRMTPVKEEAPILPTKKNIRTLAKKIYDALKEGIWNPLFWDEKNKTSQDPEKLNIGDHPLIEVFCEPSSEPGKVNKINLGAFYLGKALNDPELGPKLIERTQKTAKGINKRLNDAYETDVEYVIWPGMGGSIEDKNAAIATKAIEGVNGKKLIFFGVDNVDSETLQFIYDKIVEQEREKSGELDLDYEIALKRGLKKTVVVAQALGMTSYEPVYNADNALKPIFAEYGLKLEDHFYKITIDNSYVDKALEGCQRIVHQPDQADASMPNLKGNATTSGRHDGPYTNGMLLPLALAGIDLQKWVSAANIKEEEVLGKSMPVSAWMVMNEKQGINKIVTTIPKEWQGDTSKGAWEDGALWIKQDFEESLGKDRDHLLKIVMNDDLDLKNCEPVVTGKNDKAFLVIRVKGLTNVSEKKIDQLKKAGYSVMVLDFDDDEAAQQLDDKVLLARIMSVVHWSVFGVAEQWNICAVDQPPVEFYKKIVDWMRLKKANFTRTIKAITESRYAATKDEITLNWHAMVQRGLFTEEELINELEALSAKTGRALNIFDPAHVSAAIHSIALKKGDIEYGELAHSGETSYTKDGLAMRDVLNHGDDVLWRKTLKKFADVGKLPGSGHAYHAMIKAAQKCLTTSLIGMNHLEQFKNSNVKYSSDYLKMHWLGNLLALSGYDIKREDGQKLEDGKLVAKDKPGWAMSLIFDENNEDTRHALKAYFDEVADILEKARPSILDTIEKRSKVLDSSM